MARSAGSTGCQSLPSANPAALDPRSGNVYASTDASGEFNLREAGVGGAGVVAPVPVYGFETPICGYAAMGS